VKRIRRLLKQDREYMIVAGDVSWPMRTTFSCKASI
jgi:hypothetical protein